jgi:hypothetical protein
MRALRKNLTVGCFACVAAIRVLWRLYLLIISLNCARRPCKDAMGEGSSLQDRSVLGVSRNTIPATLCAFTSTKGLQDSPHTERTARLARIIHEEWSGV